MATPNWLAETERVIGAGHPLFANTKDRCGQTIQNILEVAHTTNGVHLVRSYGLVMEVGSFSGNASARIITLSNSNLTPKKVLAWQMTGDYLVGSELVTNGEFSTDTSGWTGGGADFGALLSAAGGQSGNCLNVQSAGGGGERYAYQALSGLMIGANYYLDYYWLSATPGSSGIVYWGTSAGTGGTLVQSLSAGGGNVWQHYTSTQVASATTMYLTIGSADVGTAYVVYFDTVSIKESKTGSAPEFATGITTDKAIDSRIDGNYTADLIYDIAVGEFSVGASATLNASGEDNYYCVIGVDTTTVPTGDSGAGSDPDWIESSVLNRINADNSAVVSSDNISNDVESQIWTEYIEEHTVAGAHSITLEHARIDSVTWSGNDGDNRDIACNITDLDIDYVEVYKDGAVVSSKSSDMAGDTTKNEATAAFAANYIQDISTAGEFTVGTALNASGSTYVALIVGT